MVPEIIESVFGVTAVVIPHPVTGSPLCLPVALAGAHQDGPATAPPEVG